MKKASTEFSVAPLINTNSVILTYLKRETIHMSPDYQRPGNIWSLDKKQLLIDSIINKFDIPKLYFHEFQELQSIDGRKKRYAVIDGKQRLSAIWEFISNSYPLADGFEFLADSSFKLSGLTYEELAARYPELKAEFDNFPLAITTVRTNDTELIEDLFSRLNEAVPLNSAERRNAFGGPIPPLIRKLSEHQFFAKCLPFPNSRYRHFDVACKFLYLAQKRIPTDTKKIHLDEFVRKQHSVDNAKELSGKALKVVDTMSKVFVEKDKLLKNIGTLTAYYLVFAKALELAKLGAIKRSRLIELDRMRLENSEVAAKDLAKADYQLLRFNELMGTLNDEFAIRFRCHVLSRHLFGDSHQITRSFEEKVGPRPDSTP